MTNTARLGARYELLYKARLEATGWHMSARQAGSKGTFDLVGWTERACWHFALTSKRISCARAYARSTALRTTSSLPRACGVVYVHRTRSREYCEH